MFSLPGLAFAYAMNSLTLLAGTVGWMTITFGTPAASVMGTKSLTGSNGILLPLCANSAALIACVPTVPISSV